MCPIIRKSCGNPCGIVFLSQHSITGHGIGKILEHSKSNCRESNSSVMGGSGRMGGLSVYLFTRFYCSRTVYATALRAHQSQLMQLAQGHQTLPQAEGASAACDIHLNSAQRRWCGMLRLKGTRRCTKVKDARVQLNNCRLKTYCASRTKIKIANKTSLTICSCVRH